MFFSRRPVVRIAWSGRVSEFSFLGIITFVVVLGILLSLGHWQLSRAAEKRAIQDQRAEASNLEPLKASDLFTSEDIDFRPAVIEGEWTVDRVLLLDNSIRAGTAGYEVLTPMSVHGGVILVNRGWIARSPVRAELPPIPAVKGSATVSGYVVRPSERAFTLKDDDFSSPSWPMVIQKIDMKGISSLFSQPLSPLVLRMSPDLSSGMVRDWQIVAMGPEKHEGYAVQWFGLALAWGVIFVVANTTNRKGI